MLEVIWHYRYESIELNILVTLRIKLLTYPSNFNTFIPKISQIDAILGFILMLKSILEFVSCIIAIPPTNNQC